MGAESPEHRPRWAACSTRPVMLGVHTWANESVSVYPERSSAFTCPEQKTPGDDALKVRVGH